MTKSAQGTEVCQNFKKEKCRYRKHSSENFSVGYVGGLCCLQSAATQGPAIARARYPLNYAYFDHPDCRFVDFILKGIRPGVDIGYQGPQRSSTSPNWPSSLTNKKRKR